MANDEKEGAETSTRGTEWEVVSLTASAYAAAPGPKGFGPNNDVRGNDVDGDDEASRAFFMSDHFVFPPSQHENLPLEPDSSEIHNEPGGNHIGSNEVPRMDMEEGDISSVKYEDNWNAKGLTIPDEFPGIQFFDEKGNRLSVHATEFEEGSALQGINLVHGEQNIYTTTKFGSFHGEADISGSTLYDDNTVISDNDPSKRSFDYPSDLSKPLDPTKEDKFSGSGLPCEAWWKRRVASLYAHAKEANAFWSVVVAAALMGLVVIGHRWQQQRWQVQQLKWQLSTGDEMNRMLGPISRLKDVIVGGHRQGSAIRGSTSAER
ncbi:PREDICTED: ATG8-interacting protein 1 isoform X2 [Nelumbo nucifera]|uniref:ATG8-interacting protein 1 isoform X2 n=1 Tax=Nelumbo nucifera TaxID=4432 RepID=A0A1U8Q3D4_NELNU|nr:PREDICTED: ATG8-interacting protein 1 isoform X2 [Nelumbo nucifera]